MLMAQTACAEGIPEYELKSAFIYNFATFIDWPAETGNELVLCVAAPQPALDQFKQLESKPVGSMKLVVRHLARGGSVASCNILYVASSEDNAFESWLPELEGKKVLTVAESERWVKKGVMIDLVIEGRRIVFDVNADAARQVGLNINSRLLRLARKVYAGGEGGSEK